MIAALPEAVKLWNNPRDLLDLWDSLDSKIRHEGLVIDVVGVVDTVADLGCGSGRYAEVLKCNKYFGFDGSVPMVAEAITIRLSSKAEFATADIFNFQPSEKFSAALMIDVVHHQNEPVEAILRMMELWKADFYVFSLLVGSVREDLYNSTVVSFSDLLKIYDRHQIESTYIERFDDNAFAWVLLKAKGVK